jgi:hypothetical protein
MNLDLLLHKITACSTVSVQTQEPPHRSHVPSRSLIRMAFITYKEAMPALRLVFSQAFVTSIGLSVSGWATNHLERCYLLARRTRLHSLLKSLSIASQ